MSAEEKLRNLELETQFSSEIWWELILGLVLEKGRVYFHVSQPAGLMESGNRSSKLHCGLSGLNVFKNTQELKMDFE